MDLLKIITDNTGISQEQAGGGIGLLLNLAQSKLSGEHFDKLCGLIPNASALQAAAPVPGNLASAVSGLTSMFGGSVSQAGALAPVLDGCAKLGIDEPTALKIFTSVVDFLKTKGGHDVAAVVYGLTKG